jgi:hypothetical protein
MLTLLDLRERGGRLEPTKLEIDPATAETVREILQRVFVEGDEVLVALAAEFDKADLSETGILVDDEAFARAERDTPDDLKQALDDLIERLRDLAGRQTPREWWHERDGVRFGEIVRPLRTIGCYVPGGRARYPSTVAMTVVPGGRRRRRGDRGVHAAPERRIRSGAGAVRSSAGGRDLRRAHRRRASGRGDGLRHRVDPGGRPDRRAGQRVRDRGEAPGRRVRRDRRPGRALGARDRRRRRRRPSDGGPGPDRAGRARPARMHLSS